MSSIKKPHNWLCFVAFAAAFWITFRVMAADRPVQSTRSIAAEVADPALEQLVAHFASDGFANKR